MALVRISSFPLQGQLCEHAKGLLFRHAVGIDVIVEIVSI
jgi:hypothetical protein